MITTSVTALFLALIVVGSSAVIGQVVVRSVDPDLQQALLAASSRVGEGLPPEEPNSVTSIHVLDTAGTPVDGGPTPELSPADLDRLRGGDLVLTSGTDPARRWKANVVPTPDGTPRLVLAATDLVGFAAMLRTGLILVSGSAALAVAAAAVVTVLSVRGSLRSVRRMRNATVGLPSGARLPVPDTRDELSALADAFNDLLARRDEAVGRLRRFTGDAAHELRSPVTSIRAQAEVAVLHPDPQHSMEVLEEVVQETERLTTLVEDLLALARSDAGDVRETRVVSLPPIARQVAARHRGGDVKVVLYAPVEVRVLADPVEVDRVMENLVANAVRHARLLVRVTVLPFGRFGRLLVDDDGPGIDAEHRDQVFDRFFRLEGDRARDSGGTGLGLALVSEVVSRRGGSASVHVAPEGGARFQVTWPTAYS
ncbi:signal transduction histidine kinase [Actinoalloteichus hoggarensis]|nr:HAMP domain-containing sensor histidine kinase [Actinoalloteichus hoggarensis]MBB5921861.1 signal transduction histidine kinase [Actinoalloteichus hoggarensis]